MQRQDYLKEAEHIICRQRQDVHGKPENTFLLIAEYWSVYLSKECDQPVIITDADVAVMMALLKIARLQNNMHNEDNILDGIGYLALAGELITSIQGSDEVLNER